MNPGSFPAQGRRNFCLLPGLAGPARFLRKVLVLDFVKLIRPILVLDFASCARFRFLAWVLVRGTKILRSEQKLQSLERAGRRQLPVFVLSAIFFLVLATGFVFESLD
jgi:hypothetical protein